MLVDEIKKQMMAAMKAHDTVRKEILRVALGEISVAVERGAGKISDEETVAIVRKLIKSDEETLSLATDEAQKITLREEIEILRTLVPKTLGVDDIVAALEPVKEAMRGAANDGQATGLAMKHLKSVGALVDGKDVSLAMKKVRA